MPYLGIAKERLADRLGLAATKGEGRQNMLGAYLAGALLLGLLGERRPRGLVARPGRRLPIAGIAIKEPSASIAHIAYASCPLGKRTVCAVGRPENG